MNPADGCPGEDRSAPRAAPRGSAILVIRPSSLGDVVHALAVVADAKAHRPELAIDWVAEEAFAPLVALHPDVRNTIPVALRRWRREILSASAWREFAAFRAELRRERYVAVIDLQEQLKGSALAAMARGPSHGPTPQGAREPLAALWHDLRHPVPRGQHFQDRCRQLAAASLGYAVDGPPQFGLAPPPLPRGLAPEAPYAVLAHGTSRDDKLWPEDHWRSLAAALGLAGIRSLLPWGNEAERARGSRIAAGVATARVLPQLALPALASLLAGASIVVGVDTGLAHLAAALGTPTLALFVATDPAQAGVARAGARSRDLGGPGRPPTPDEVRSAAAQLLRSAPHC